MADEQEDGPFNLALEIVPPGDAAMQMVGFGVGQGATVLIEVSYDEATDSTSVSIKAGGGIGADTQGVTELGEMLVLLGESIGSKGAQAAREAGY